MLWGEDGTAGDLQCGRALCCEAYKPGWSQPVRSKHTYSQLHGHSGVTGPQADLTSSWSRCSSSLDIAGLDKAADDVSLLGFETSALVLAGTASSSAASLVTSPCCCCLMACMTSCRRRRCRHCCCCCCCCIPRLAIVPMSQEARGLDAGQRLATRLVGCGDNRSASIVSRIAEEERAHVAVGEFDLFPCFKSIP